MADTVTKRHVLPTDTSPNWAPIIRPPLPEEVATRIRQMIEDGALMPGSRIAERQLCTQLGVSRTPLREAIRVLAANGVLELRPRRGAIVKRLDVEEIDHMFQVLEALEALAGELACDLISDAELSEIEELHKKMLSCFRRRERRVFFEINQEFHERIVKAASNPILTRIYEGLSGQVRQVRYLAKISDTQWPVAVREHEKIMRALKARNKRALSAALRTHLKTKRERVKTLLTM